MFQHMFQTAHIENKEFPIRILYIQRLSDLAPKCMGVRPDKGEVGGSSPPRPTILVNDS